MALASVEDQLPQREQASTLSSYELHSGGKSCLCMCALSLMEACVNVPSHTSVSLLKTGAGECVAECMINF